MQFYSGRKQNSSKSCSLSVLSLLLILFLSSHCCIASAAFCCCTHTQQLYNSHNHRSMYLQATRFSSTYTLFPFIAFRFLVCSLKYFALVFRIVPYVMPTVRRLFSFTHSLSLDRSLYLCFPCWTFTAYNLAEFTQQNIQQSISYSTVLASCTTHKCSFTVIFCLLQ